MPPPAPTARHRRGRTSAVLSASRPTRGRGPPSRYAVTPSRCLSSRRPPRRTRRVALPRGHITPAAGLPSADQGRQRGVGRRPGQAAREVVGGWPSPARSWRSSSEAAWLETPRRARSASRVIGCHCCPGARRRPAGRPSGAPRPPRPGPRPASRYRDGRPGADGRLPSTAVLARCWAGRRAARRSIMETATRNTAATIRAPGRQLGAGEVGRQAQQCPTREHRDRPRQPPGDDALLLVALPLAGGHRAGQVDADSHGPGHRTALAVLGGGVADMGERPRPGDGREHGDGQREQAAGGAHEPSGRPPVPDGPAGRPRPGPGLARLPPCRSGTARVNAESFTPGCLLNARPPLTLPAATVPPTTERRPGRAGAELRPHLQKSGFGCPFTSWPEIRCQRGRVDRLSRESRVPGVVLSRTFRVTLVYPGLPFRRAWPSHGGGLPTVAFHARRGLEGREHLGLYVDAVAVFAGTRAGAWRASGSAAGVQPLGLRDPERRHGRSWTAAASPPAPSFPRQVTSRLIPAPRAIDDM
jgi:hypothetical protein